MDIQYSVCGTIYTNNAKLCWFFEIRVRYTCAHVTLLKVTTVWKRLFRYKYILQDVVTYIIIYVGMDPDNNPGTSEYLLNCENIATSQSQLKQLNPSPFSLKTYTTTEILQKV